MASKFILAKGSSISLSPDGTTFTPVKQIQQVDYSGGKMEFDDVTNIDSPGGVHEWVPTLNDSGDVQVSGVFSDQDPGQLMFDAAFAAQTLMTVKMQMAPTGTQTKGFLRSFQAYVSAPCNISYGTTKAMSFKGSLKITGLVTDTAGS